MSHLSNLFFPNCDTSIWETIELSWTVSNTSERSSSDRITSDGWTVRLSFLPFSHCLASKLFVKFLNELCFEFGDCSCLLERGVAFAFPEPIYCAFFWSPSDFSLKSLELSLLLSVLDNDGLLLSFFLKPNSYSFYFLAGSNYELLTNFCSCKIPPL